MYGWVIDRCYHSSTWFGPQVLGAVRSLTFTTDASGSAYLDVSSCRVILASVVEDGSSSVAISDLVSAFIASVHVPSYLIRVMIDSGLIALLIHLITSRYPSLVRTFAISWASLAWSSVPVGWVNR
jgi:hypothetical protein